MNQSDLIAYPMMLGIMAFGFLISYSEIGLKPILIIVLIPSVIIVVVYTKTIRPIMNDTQVGNTK